MAGADDLMVAPLSEAEGRRLCDAREAMRAGRTFTGWVAEEIQSLMLREYLTKTTRRQLRRAS